MIQRYTRTAMVFHWLVAALIAANVIMIWVVDSLPDTMARPVIDTHKSFGITVLGLAIMRVLWRATHAPPALPPGYPKWERWSAHAAHGVLYLLIFCLPLSGWMHDSAWKEAATHPMYLYGLIPWPRIGWLTAIDPAQKDYWHDLFGRVHTAFAYVLYAMVVAHVAGALKHQWFDREPELQRMLPGRDAVGLKAEEPR
ncbi:cytochrome b [Lichenihabitans psoromatis]|uniref:cytochrome b n=1 Tax=Lichenihabitans psoromatis TaxID=2528642 RepID=UPI001036D942|nr:cytochrome b [Lichenihabitans psoromatis]